MSVFFTDSDCELWYTDVDKYDMKVLEMPYVIDGEEKFYDMGRNTNFKEMYDKMRAGAVPTTSALNEEIYTEAFEPYFKKGEDILYVHFSDKLSGTFEHMNVAVSKLKKQYPGVNFTTFNTKSISVGAGFSVLEAAKMHKAGKSDEEIIEFLNNFSSHIAVEFCVESLSHLRRGGRISATTAVVGGLLNIKPILTVSNEGTIEKIGTAKGMKKAIAIIADKLIKNIQHIEKYPIYIIDADNKEIADFAENYIKSKLDGVKIERMPIGPVIACHCGPGTVGLIYYGK